MTPGVYRINFRGLSLREAWRFGGGPLRFVIALFLKAGAVKAGKLWLPAHECEEPCAEADLSPEARQELLPVVTEARALGYTEGRFGRAVRILDPNMKQGFSYLALHRDRQRDLFVGFVVNSAAGNTRRVTALSGALVGADGTNHEFINHRQHFDNGGLTRKHQLRSRTVTEFDAALQSFMATARDTFRTFDHLTELKAYLQPVEERSFETRIARGLLCYVDAAPPAASLRRQLTTPRGHYSRSAPVLRHPRPIASHGIGKRESRPRGRLSLHTQRKFVRSDVQRSVRLSQSRSSALS